MAVQANILVIDDDESMRIGCIQTLREQGYRVKSAENGADGLEMIEKESFDVILLDLKMPGISGLDMLKKIHEIGPNHIIIVITGHGTIDVAVETMRHGAYNFLTKPFTPEALCRAVGDGVHDRRRMIENVVMGTAPGFDSGPDTIVGRSPEIKKVIRLVRKVASTDSTVLIYGETGSGKELIARALHRMSYRCCKPFVSVDCGSIVESLFESEMFGHIKGSFTGAVETTRGKFEMADGGTLFLDEISNVSINMQARLLRAIQEREISKVGSSEKISVDVRITAVTNKDLLKEIDQGRFREDLYYRLNVVPIRIPPLRERGEDIRLLAEHFLKKMAEQSNRPPPGLTRDAGEFLERYGWPGNVRELKNRIERGFVTFDGKQIDFDDLTYDEPDFSQADFSESGFLSKLEKKEIAKVLKRFKGHRSKTAEYLGINRKTLREKIQKYEIEI